LISKIEDKDSIFKIKDEIKTKSKFDNKSIVTRKNLDDHKKFKPEVRINKYEIFNGIPKMNIIQNKIFNRKNILKSNEINSEENGFSKQSFKKERNIIQNNITNVNLTVVNLIDERILNVDLLEKFKNTSKYYDIKNIYKNLENTKDEQQNFEKKQIKHNSQIKFNHIQKNKKISWKTLFRNKEIDYLCTPIKISEIKSTLLKGFKYINIYN